MPSMTDLLGSLMKSGMSESTSGRIEHSLGERGLGGAGGLLEQIFGKQLGGDAGASASTAPGASAGGALDSLGQLATAVLGRGTQGKAAAAGGIGAIAGALLGGGSKSLKGAIGGGALALLGSLALQAFRNAGHQQAEDMAIDPSAKLMAGLRDPETADEERQVQSLAELTLKAMVNAAKADGQIDDEELQRIVGKVQEDGVSGEEREFLMREMRKPMATDEIVREANTPQVAAQVYAASLLAVDLDSTSEREYMRDLATKLRLDGNVVRQLHSTLGVA